MSVNADDAALNVIDPTISRSLPTRLHSAVEVALDTAPVLVEIVGVNDAQSLIAAPCTVL